MRHHAHILVDAPEIARQEVGVDGRRRIVRVADNDIVAEVAQQRARLVDRGALLLADLGDQRRWNLGAQGNSQPAGMLGGRGDEPTVRTGNRRRHVEEQRGVFAPTGRSGR